MGGQSEASISWQQRKGLRKEQKHLSKDSTFIVKNGAVLERTEAMEKEMVNGVHLDDADKERLSDFVLKHSDLVGNANVNRMREIKWLLRRLGIKGKRLADLLY